LGIFCVKGPAKKEGVFCLNSINPLFTKNQIPTSPPWIPMQFHNEPLYLIHTNDRNIPSKINPKRYPNMFH